MKNKAVEQTRVTSQTVEYLGSLRNRVMIKLTSVTGKIIGLNTDEDGKNSYCLRYVNSVNDSCERWFREDEINFDME